MKKNYLKPEMESLFLQTDALMASIPGPLDQDDFYGTGVLGKGGL